MDYAFCEMTQSEVECSSASSDGSLRRFVRRVEATNSE